MTDNNSVSPLVRLEQLEQQLKSGKRNKTLFLDMLKVIRENNVRRSDLIVLCGQELFFNEESKKNMSEKQVEQWSSGHDNIFNLYEQVLKAALDLNQLTLADLCLEQLQTKFDASQSSRVKKLEALLFEAKDEWEMAESIYDEYPSDPFCIKRKIAFYKSVGNTNKAIETLIEYIRVFMTDVEAYQELIDLYLSVMEYKKALFVVEECILSQPLNYLFYLKYADISYTLGEFHTARKYYAHSISINPSTGTNVKSYYGLLLSLSNTSGTGNSVGTELKQQIEKELMEAYSKENKEMASLIKKVLLKMN